MPETILIIDDASNQLRMTRYAINQRLGYHVVTVAGSEEAARWVLSGCHPQPDLLLLDISLPGVAGLDLVRELKSSRPHLPVVVLVPYGDEESAAQAVQAGVNDFLCKPVTFDRLKLSLRNALALCRLMQTVARLEWRLAGNGFPGEKPSSVYDGEPPDNAARLFDGQGRVRKLKSIEEEVIRLVLRHNNGCMTRAARQLGIGRSTLYRRVSGFDGEDGYISRANQATRPIMRVSAVERS